MGKAILMEASEPTARAGNNDNDDEQFVDEAEVLETGALSALGQGKSITDNQNSTDDHDDDTSYCSNSSHQQQQQYDGLDDGEKERILELFDVIDYDQKGKLAKEDLCYFFTSLAERRRIKLDKRVVAMAVDALLGKNRDDSSFQGNHDDDDDDITIDRDDFLAIFAEHRDVYRVIDETEPGVHHHHEDDGFSVSCQSVDDSDETMGQPKKDPQKSFQIAMEAYWKNCRKYAFWIVLYLATCMFVFILTAIKWARNDEAVEVFGNCIVVARASAKAINFHAALVLLPITRHLTTWTRWGWLRGILFPVDALQKAHMFLGLALIFFTTTHVLAHICDYTRFLGANQDDLWLLLEDRVDDLPPLDTEGRLEWALRQRATTTGVYMLICLIPALAALFNRRQNFDRFWIFHHLLVLMLIIMCYHGTASLFEDYQTIYWVSIPLSFYLFPRVYREIKCSDAQVIHASVHEDIVDLRLRKPAHWKWVQKPGMYAVLNVPELSLLEWHPFTMSSCPSDSEVTFHIKAAGDWTKKLHSLISNASSISKSSELNFAVRLEGPFGSPSQNYRDYPVIVLIGAGMGVTPMISVIRSLLDNPGKVRKAFFYWTKRESSSMFSDLMEEIYNSDTENLIEIRHFITSVKFDDRDLGDVLFHHAANAVHAESDLDIFLGYRTNHYQVGVGRPNWRWELQHAVQTTQQLGEKECGVFLCGPEAMAQDVQRDSLALSKEDNGVHFYFTKEVF